MRKMLFTIIRKEIERAKISGNYEECSNFIKGYICALWMENLIKSKQVYRLEKILYKIKKELEEN